MKPVVKPFPSPGRLLAGASFADSFAITVDGLGLDAVDATRRAFERVPAWVSRLMALRNLMVRPFRLKTGASDVDASRGRIGFFPVLSQSPSEVVLGLDDRHLDFRVSVQVRELGVGRQEVSASTAVRPHNVFGRAYLFVVKPFHRAIVPAMLAQVLRD